MNKNLYLKYTVQKHIDLVDLEKKEKELQSFELSNTQIQEMVEIETKKLLELLDLYEKNLHNKDLQYEFKSTQDIKVKAIPIINPILQTMNEILQESVKNEENTLDNHNDLKVDTVTSIDEVIQNEIIGIKDQKDLRDNKDQIEKKQTRKDKKKFNKK
jgi:hypothetical protein